ncbi:OmpA family protein [Lichenicoccus sp.]|uniref:OmpA family protein n=1 Tax=Lichenicoccus sp. TaxID=2781899 RepID=UPI003D126D46
MKQPRVRWAVRTLFLITAPGLAGCAHQGVVGTPVSWWHQVEGGAIAKQRPPPPGVNDPYPAIGTTPAHPPQVASLALRQSVTDALQRQRNLTTRLDANTPLPPAPPRSSPGASPPAPGAASATLAAAQAAPGPQQARPAADPSPELALPAVQVQPAGDAAPVELPAIPGAPPPPPRLPGVRAVAGIPASAPLPDYQVIPAAGTRIAFAPGTDSIRPDQQGALHALAVQRGAGNLLVHGYGDADAASADAQAQALTLASLRAGSVARALQDEGVPASSILLQAQAFGRGASVSLVP